MIYDTPFNAMDIQMNLANHLIDKTQIKTHILVMFACQFKQREAVVVPDHHTVIDLIQVDQAAAEDEERYHRFGGMSGYDQRMCFARWRKNVASGVGNPTMLEIAPATAQRVTMHRAYVIMRIEPLAGFNAQNVGKTAAGDVEEARLKPHAINIGN